MGALPFAAGARKPTFQLAQRFRWSTSGCTVSQGFTDLRCLPPTGAPMAPPLLGGGSFCSEFTGKFAGNLEYSGIGWLVN